MALHQLQYDVTPSKDDPSVFALTLSYDRQRTSPTQLFRTAADLTHGLGTIDAAAATAIDRQLLVGLEAVAFETGSLKTWLASVIRSLDDEALKSGEIKKIVGSYLVRSKYFALEWLNDTSSKKSIGELEAQLRVVASETDIRFIPAYSTPSRTLLIDGLREVESAKSSMRDSEEISYESGGGDVRLITSLHTDFEALSDVTITQKRENHVARTNLIVKKPDYLGQSQWQVRIGDHTVRAKIADARWLSQFQGREIALQPGDALICDATFFTSYDQSGTPISDSITVNQIFGVEYQLNPLGTPPLL